jgi:hypothetical protein
VAEPAGVAQPAGAAQPAGPAEPAELPRAQPRSAAEIERDRAARQEMQRRAEAAARAQEEQ